MESFLSLFDPGPRPSKGRASKRSSCNGTFEDNGNPTVSPVGEEPDPSSTVPEDLPPEPELGNVEYKLKLINPSKSRLEHLVTQVGISNLDFVVNLSILIL